MKSCIEIESLHLRTRLLLTDCHVDSLVPVISVSGYTVTIVLCRAAIFYRDDYTRSSPYQDL